MVFDPPRGAQAKGGTDNDEKFVLGQPADGHVALYGAATIAHLRVDHFPDGPIDLIGTEPVQKSQGARSFHLEFAERGLVDKHHIFPCVLVFGSHVFKPVGSLKGQVVFGFHTIGSKPIGPFPPVFGAVNCTLFLQQVIQRTVPYTARGIMLFMGPVDGVMLAVNFTGSFHIVFAAFVVRAEPADIKGPDIQTRFSFDDPFGHHAACSAACCDAERVESHRHKAVIQLRGRTHNGVAVRREGFRTVYQPGDAGFFQARGALYSRNGE